MNQMLQDPEVKDPPEAKVSSEAKHSPEVTDPPPVRVHPRFAKPQRVAFVQSSWHREVVEECRLAFLSEIEARGFARAHMYLFEGPVSFKPPLHAHLLAKPRRYTAI